MKGPMYGNQDQKAEDQWRRTQTDHAQHTAWFGRDWEYEAAQQTDRKAQEQISPQEKEAVGDQAVDESIRAALGWQT